MYCRIVTWDMDSISHYIGISHRLLCRLVSLQELVQVKIPSHSEQKLSILRLGLPTLLLDSIVDLHHQPRMLPLDLDSLYADQCYMFRSKHLRTSKS